MGMYTQIRGWLNVTGNGEMSVYKLREALDEAKRDYRNQYPDSRTWICKGTHLPLENNDFNGEHFIFIGVQLKNYDDDYRRWLDVLLKHFPWAQGRWDVQYEEWYYDERDPDNVLTIRIRDGKRYDDYEEVAWCRM